MLAFGTTKQYSEHLCDHGDMTNSVTSEIPLTAMFMVLNAKICYKILWSQNMWLISIQSYCSILFTLCTCDMQNMKRPPSFRSLHSHGAVGASILSLVYSEHCLATNYTILEEPLGQEF